MSALLSFPLVWSQIPAQRGAGGIRPVLTWLFLLGEPGLSIPGIMGAVLTWLKILGLFCLVAWVFSWVAAALKERASGHGSRLDILALIALIISPSAVLIRTLETTGRLPVWKIGGVYLVTLIAASCGAMLFVWVELVLWKLVRKLGRTPDVLVLVGLHVALVLGVLIGHSFVQGVASFQSLNTGQAVKPSLQESAVYGARLAATYMGYVVLFRVILQVLAEVFAMRPRRLYSIAKLSVIESTRRMWAPYVVVTVFLVILAFTHWFLQAPRPAEMGRLFVGTLSLLCSLLLTVMVTILTPLSLPQDIQNQTIYTVVSKPVRRIELIWGRILGFMAIVTVLVFVFYGISLLYLWRTVGGAIAATEAKAVQAQKDGRKDQAIQLREQADQLRTRMAARVPVYGALSFTDSKGEKHAVGIDVGSEQSRQREPRSHIEGATAATAIWRFGQNIPDPFDKTGRITIDRPIPVEEFLPEGTVEGLYNRMFEIDYQIRGAERMLNDPNFPASRVTQVTAGAARNREEYKRVSRAYEQAKADAEKLEAAADKLPPDRAGEADRLRREAAALHAPPITIEMTFNIYRTTKGKLGEPVYAELKVTNLATNADYGDIFPVHEYYTNKRPIPARILAGSHGEVKIEIHCLTSSQYLGMAESDLFLLARPGNFGLNFLKGLFGVWLQAMVLTAIGVCAGTFLSWPVALLTTIAFFVSGQIAFAFLLEFTNQGMEGGGPFESMIRLLSHDNLVSELDPTLAVVAAKTLDALVMPFMSRLVYVVPNFSALDVSNIVADGFDVSKLVMFANLLLAFAYALPFSIAGYFILRNREVAA